METDEDVKIVLYILAESVAARLRENGFRCRTVEINVRDKELFHFFKTGKVAECEQYYQRDCRGWIQVIQRQLQTTGG